MSTSRRHMLEGREDVRPRLRQPAPTVIAELARAGVVAAFTTRLGGVSRPPFDQANVSSRVGDDPAAVATNRAALVRAAGLGTAPVSTVRQQHGRAVVPVSRAGAPDGCTGRLPVADGMVTATPGVVLLVGVADCVAVLLTDAGARVVAALHVGWRGLCAGVVESGVAAVQRLGGRPEDLLALVGPSIGPCCFTVGTDVLTRVGRAFPSASAQARDGSPSLDLPAAVGDALRAAGVRRRLSWRECTACLPDTYFSRRRDGTTGSQAGLVGLLPQDVAED